MFVSPVPIISTFWSIITATICNVAPKANIIPYDNALVGPNNCKQMEIMNIAVADERLPIIVNAPAYEPLTDFPVLASAWSTISLIIANGNTIVPTKLHIHNVMIISPTTKITPWDIGISRINIP